jgi:uncharacterized ion transporter superfamily protein YfcC
MRSSGIALLLVPCLAVLATPAQAYVDPNVGSQLWQAIYPVIAVLMGALAFARHWIAHALRRLVAALRSLFARDPA